MNLDRASLLLMVGLPMAVLSAFTIWIGWPIDGFFGLVALGLALGNILSSSTGTPKGDSHIKIKIG